MRINSTSFNVWVRYFVWNFKVTLWNSTQNITPIYWKIWFLYNIEISRALRFQSSYAFLKRPPGLLCQPVTHAFLSQRGSNAERAPTSWRHHRTVLWVMGISRFMDVNILFIWSSAIVIHKHRRLWFYIMDFCISAFVFTENRYMALTSLTINSHDTSHDDQKSHYVNLQFNL